MSKSPSSNDVIIAVDAMGGDHGPSEVIPALALAVKGRPNVHFLVFGDQNEIQEYLSKQSVLNNRVTIHHTDKKVANDDKPSEVLRASKGTSMRMAIEAVKNGEAKAVVSAGNTGVLMAMSKMVLKTVKGIHRPALGAVLPGSKKDSIVLDLGANLLVDAENLVQFALLGSIFAQAQLKVEKPSVGVLNVGSEDMKGPDHVREAAEILSRIDLPGAYYGFVEGNDITKGTVDVVVTDGYAGNIALKAIEGTGKMLKDFIVEAFSSNPLTMLGGVFSYFSLRHLKRRMDPRNYNGAVFLGLNGISIKSHGGADAVGFSSAVITAIRLAREDYIDQVIQEIDHLTEQENFASTEAVTNTSDS